TTTTAISTVGQQVPFTFTVTNTSNVAMTGVNVTDVQAAPSLAAGMSTISCPSSSLAAGASETCTATYTVTQADLDHGSVVDTATAHGTPAGSSTPVDSPPSTVTVPATVTGGLTVVKATSTSAISAVGQQVPFTFAVTNT